MSSPRVGILAPMPEEAAGLVRVLRLRPEGSHHGVPFYRSQTVSLVCSGLGQERAQHAMHWLQKVDRPRSILIAGVAGGLDPELVTGDLLLAEGGEPAWLAAVAGRLPRARVGKLLTSGRVIVKARNKAAVFADTGALAVDMETWAAAGVARVPWLGLRAISDTAGQDLPLDFNDYFDDKGHSRYAAVALEVARRPALLPGLLRLAGNSVKAVKRLGEAVRVALEEAP
ncbi:MAG: hypothetical protein AB7S38_21875 [Vulcanimicrobiota bacterium]